MIGIFLLLFLIRLPVFISDGFLTIPELNWMLIGEKLAAFQLPYIGVWDNVAPLSALTYGLIDLMFGRSQLAYVVIATLLVTYQCSIFNGFLLGSKAYNENTFVPALVYGLLASCFFDFFTLSPVLLSFTWVLLAIRVVFYQVDSPLQDVNILTAGLLLSLAALFYLPSAVFLCSILFAFILFANLTLRQYLLLIYGSCLPIVFVALIFYWLDGFSPFVRQYLLSYFNLEPIHTMGLFSLLFIGFVPLIFFLIALFRVTQESIRYNNHQTRLQQVMLAMLGGGLLILMLDKERSAHHLLFIVPPLAFYITHYFLNIERIILAEALMSLLLIYVVMVNYGALYEFFGIDTITKSKQLLVQPTPYDDQVQGKKILMLGENLNVYKNAQLATPYLDWQLSAPKLREVDYYDNLSQVYVNFSNDMPEIIIDETQTMPPLLSRIPKLKAAYQKQGNLYLLKQQANN